ncbi:transcriptional regulator [uncultured archaeon]|nr:transcriptional regulator [uncultured archaeon]
MQDKLDKKDVQILRYLTEHGRDKISEISNNLGIPRATVFERMERLRKEGYIKQYTVKVDYEKIGYPILAYILINFDFHSDIDQTELARELGKLENVISASVIAGGWDILLMTVHRSMKELSNFVLGKLRSMEGIEKTLSVPIFDLVK